MMRDANIHFETMERRYTIQNSSQSFELLKAAVRQKWRDRGYKDFDKNSYRLSADYIELPIKRREMTEAEHMATVEDAAKTFHQMHETEGGSDSTDSTDSTQ